MSCNYITTESLPYHITLIITYITFTIFQGWRMEDINISAVIYECNKMYILQEIFTCWDNNVVSIDYGIIIIDREAREIMYLVASVRLSVRLSVRPSVSPLTAVGAIASLRCWYVCLSSVGVCG